MLVGAVLAAAFAASFLNAAKAEMIPPSGPRRAQRSVRLVVPGEGRGQQSLTWQETFSPGSFHLGDPKLILAPR